MRSLLLACAASVMFLAGQARAEGEEPAISSPASVIDTVTLANVSGIVTELGATQIEQRTAEGKSAVTFVDGGIPYSMAISACDVRPGKCVALIMLVFLDTGTNNIGVDAVNGRNKDSFLATAIKVDDKTLAFGRAVLIDSGVTRKNLAMNIAVFASVIGDSIKFFNSQLVAGYQAGSGIQRVSYGSGTLRPVFANPRQLAAAVNALDASYRTARARPR
jgi:hypothetical protein